MKTGKPAGRRLGGTLWRNARLQFSRQLDDQLRGALWNRLVDRLWNSPWNRIMRGLYAHTHR